MKTNPPPTPDQATCPKSASWQDQHPDTVLVHGPLHIEKLEGRQESGRDAQDEAEEDEGE